MCERRVVGILRDEKWLVVVFALSKVDVVEVIFENSRVYFFILSFVFCLRWRNKVE